MTLAVLPIEHDLLNITRAAMGLLPAAAVYPLLRRQADLAEQKALERGLSPAATTAFRQLLARGGIRALLRRGGWRRELRRRGGQVTVARLWETEPPPLSFSAMSFELARWLTVVPLGRTDITAAPTPSRCDDGDELFAYLVCSLLVATELPLQPLSNLVGQTALAQLAFPDAIVDKADPTRVAALLDMPALCGGLQRDLAREFLLRLEVAKSAVTQPQALCQLARRAEQRLEVFVDAALARGRPEALRFVAEASPLLEQVDWTYANLDAKSPLQARQAAQDAGWGVLRIAGRVHRMLEGLRSVGFVDDDYDAAQAILTAWEGFLPSLRRMTETIHQVRGNLLGSAP